MMWSTAKRCRVLRGTCPIRSPICTNKEFDRLVVMAGPGFLGLLREALPDHVRESVAAEVPKDLVHEPLEAVKSHLPPAAFHVTPH